MRIIKSESARWLVLFISISVRTRLKNTPTKRGNGKYMTTVHSVSIWSEITIKCNLYCVILDFFLCTFVMGWSAETYRSDVRIKKILSESLMRSLMVKLFLGKTGPISFSTPWPHRVLMRHCFLLRTNTRRQMPSMLVRPGSVTGWPSGMTSLNQCSVSFIIIIILDSEQRAVSQSAHRPVVTATNIS